MPLETRLPHRASVSRYYFNKCGRRLAWLRDDQVVFAVKSVLSGYIATKPKSNLRIKAALA